MINIIINLILIPLHFDSLFYKSDNASVLKSGVGIVKPNETVSIAFSPSNSK